MSSDFYGYLSGFLVTALALNLAYVALPRFRYRRQLRKVIEERVGDSFAGELRLITEAPEGLREVAWLYDGKSKISSIFGQETGVAPCKFVDKPPFPVRLLGYYMRNWDLWASCGIIAICIAGQFAIVRSGYVLGYLDFFKDYNGFLSYMCLFFCIVPVAQVLCGRRGVSVASEYVKEQIERKRFARRDRTAQVKIDE